MFILSGDIGGTHTRLQASEFKNEQLTFLNTSLYKNHEFKKLTHIIEHFLSASKLQLSQIESACFAAAGPIVEGTVQLTNLPWFVEKKTLQKNLGIQKLELINDFQAIGYGLSLLSDTDRFTLQKGEPIPEAPKALIGAGTGLGVAILYKIGQRYEVFPTEGGHVDFAPTDDEQIELLKYLRKKLHRVSVERIVSGLGFLNIYKFVRDNPILGETENPELRRVISADSAAHMAALISTYALVHQDPLSMRALHLFLKTYGSCAGNLALSSLCFGGLYLAGGIAPQLLTQLASPIFLEPFRDKGRMSALIQKIPVYVVLDTLIGLKGATLYAASL